MDPEFNNLIDILTQEKGINKDVLMETIKHALQTAYKKKVGREDEVDIAVDDKTGAYRVFEIKNVVENGSEDLEYSDIVLRDALKYDSGATVGGTIRVDVTPKDFGRMAVLNAKQIIEQKLKEAERDSLYEEFAAKENEIIIGTVQRVEIKPDAATGKNKKAVYVNLEKTDCVMYEKDQVAGEIYRSNMKIPVFVYKVEKTTKGPKIFVSHSHPNLVVRLLEKEVPELADGSIVIKSITREAGQRTKIAVYSRIENVDPVGTCIGTKGMRINTVMKELKNEKIDVVEWNKDMSIFVSNSLLPAKVKHIEIDEESKRAVAVVADNELSVAIGKEGINVRLASKLTGMRIDIKTVSDAKKLEESGVELLEKTKPVQSKPNKNTEAVSHEPDDLDDIMKAFAAVIGDDKDASDEKLTKFGVDFDEES